MGKRLHVATHKGLFTLERDGAGSAWSIGRVSFLGDNVNMLLEDPRDGMLYAALALGHFGVKLRRSDDGGANWHECAVPVYPQDTEMTDRMDGTVKGASLSEIWSLEPSGTDEPGVLWAGTIPGGLFRSRDRGDSWEMVRSLWDHPLCKEWFGGGKDQPGIHSVCVHPTNSRHVTVGVSCGGVWVTEDGGETWACRADGMRADYMPPERQNDQHIQDPHRVVQCPGDPQALWAQHHNGIFRSTDGSASWRAVENVQPSDFGFAVAVHPRDPNTAWFVPAVKDETRVPVEGRLVVTRTRDGGATFETLTQGLPQQHAYDLIFRHALDIHPSGESLAMGSTTGSLWTTDDAGEHWQTVSTHLPPILALRFAA